MGASLPTLMSTGSRRISSDLISLWTSFLPVVAVDKAAAAMGSVPCSGQRGHGGGFGGDAAVDQQYGSARNLVSMSQNITLFL